MTIKHRKGSAEYKGMYLDRPAEFCDTVQWNDKTK